MLKRFAVFERSNKNRFLQVVTMPKEKVFSNFFLLFLNHLQDRPTDELKTEEILKRRLKYGKKSILLNTKKGDVIALESPERWTLKNFREVFLPIFREKYEKNEEMKKRLPKILARLWKRQKLNINFYAELADFARRNERKVVSLESGLWSPKSRLVKAYERVGFGFEGNSNKDKRLEFLRNERRDLGFCIRIQRIKPVMVITADGHAAVIEKEFNPVKVGGYERTLTNTAKEGMHWITKRVLGNKWNRIIHERQGRRKV